MRDPSGRLSFQESTVTRQLILPISDRDFLVSPVANRLVESGFLLPFEIPDLQTVVSPRLPFASYPFEWCDAQLHDAARLTLHIQEEAVASGYDLKDASAWNVLYDGTRPAFCDHLSFELLRTRKWWAMGQFARHFVAPLAVSRRCGFRAHRVFRAWHDGVPPAVSREMLGIARFASRYWPLMAGAGGALRQADQQALTRTIGPAELDAIKSSRVNLLTALAWMTDGLAPSCRKASETDHWSTYVEERHHYSPTSVERKTQCVSRWIESIKPDWVADFGCNTGEFSELALHHGANVVALDADHDSVQRLFRRLPDRQALFPVVADIDDLSGGCGWAGEEFAGLPARLTQRFELVMMLAVIHHLFASAAVPLQAIADFCFRCTRAWLIVELIDESDSQLKALCAQRRRNPSDFSIQRQRDAFLQSGFQQHDECALMPMPRSLLLLRRPR